MTLPSQLPAPGVSPAAERIRKGFIAPIEAFLHVQSASGILLLGAAVIALAWANSPWHESYAHVWHTPLGIRLGPLSFEKDLHFWVNDVLMTIFFFVVGLEIRREIHEGELSELKRASLPIAAALGGMVVPAGIYVALNAGKPTVGGWGVPMATDIAFAVGILALLGPRVPAALRILLLALAIIDDIGAILVIAIFYSSNLDLNGIIPIVVGFAIIWIQNRSGIRRATAYIPGAVILWLGVYQLGVHPTIAGVALGLITPTDSWFGKEGFLVEANDALHRFRIASSKPNPDDHEVMAPLDRLANARREALSPVIRLQNTLHGWSAYLIMPVFALANAGVNLTGIDFGNAHAISLSVGVFAGLVVGKPLGILLFAWVAVRSGMSTMPRGVGYAGVFIVGCTAGIGFTMAIFIAELAFKGSPGELGIAKLSVLAASVIAAVTGLVVGRFILPKDLPEDIRDMSAADAERSTEF